MPNLWQAPLSQYVHNKGIVDELNRDTIEELIYRARLKEVEATVIRMTYLEFRDRGFIADTIHCSERTVTRYRERALRRMVSALGRSE